MAKLKSGIRYLFILAVFLGITAIFWHPAKSLASPSKTEKPATTTIAATTLKEPPAEPFNWTLSNQRVAEVSRSLALPHFSKENSREAQSIIARELIGRLEKLSQSSPEQRRGVESRLSDISDALTLLERRKKLEGHSPDSLKILSVQHRPRLVALQNLWHRDPQWSRKVDNLFLSSGLLTCEHVPQLLLEWTAS